MKTVSQTTMKFFNKQSILTFFLFLDKFCPQRNTELNEKNKKLFIFSAYIKTKC